MAGEDTTAPDAGADEVKVVDDAGNPFTIPASSLDQAKQAGMRLATPDDEARVANDEKNGGVLGSAKALGLGALRGLSLGVSDPFLVGAGAQTPEDLKGSIEAHPALSAGGELGGMLAPALLSDGETAAADVEGGAAARAPGLVEQLLGNTPAGLTTKLGAGVEKTLAPMLGDSLLGRAATAGLRSAAEAVPMGAGQALSESAIDNKPLTGESLVAHVGAAAALGLAGGATLEGGLGIAQKYGPEALERAGNWLDRIAEKAEAGKVNSNEEIRSLAANIDRGHGGIEDALKKFHGEDKPAMIEHLVGDIAPSTSVAQALADVRGTLTQSEFQSGALGKAEQLFDRAADKVTNAGSLAEQQVALDKLKLGLDQVRPPKLTTGNDELMFGKLVEARRQLKDALENEGLFGPAATYQKEVNGALAPYYTAKGDLQSKFFEKVGGAKQASPAKATGFIGQVARDSPLADVKQEILSNYVTAGRDVLDRLRQTTYEPLGKTGVDVGALSRNLDEVNASVSSAAKAKAAELSMKGGGSIHGDPVLGWVHTAGIPGVLPLARMLHAGAQGELVAKVAKQSADLSRAVARGARVALEGASNKAPDLAAAFGGKASHWLADPDKVQALAADAQKAQAQLAQNTEALQKHAPGVGAAVAGVGQRALGYLAKNAPKNPVPPDGLTAVPKYEASQAQLDRYHTQARAVEHPLGVLDDLHAGTLTPGAVEAVRTVYPELYAKITREVSDALAERSAKGKSLAGAQRQQLAILLGHPVGYAQTYALPRALQQSKQPGAPGGGGSGAPPPHQRLPRSNSSGLNKMKVASRTEAAGSDSDEAR